MNSKITYEGTCIIVSLYAFINLFAPATSIPPIAPPAFSIYRFLDIDSDAISICLSVRSSLDESFMLSAICPVSD